MSQIISMIIICINPLPTYSNKTFFMSQIISMIIICINPLPTYSNKTFCYVSNNINIAAIKHFVMSQITSNEFSST
jgi:hypothetical protein